MSLANSKGILTTKISDDAYILKSADCGTNIGLLKTVNGIVLIDPMPGNENLDALNNTIKNLFGVPVKFILNTHDHIDHSGGNTYFAKKGGTFLAGAEGLIEVQEIVAKSHTLNDKVYYHAKSNIIFAGDIFDSSWHPTFYAGGLAGFNNAIEEIIKLGNNESIIVPGHGKPTSKVDLHVFQKNTFDWVSRVKKLKDDGVAATEIKNDAQVRKILDNFNLERKTDFLPEKAIIRFIERTIAVIDRDA